MAPRSTATTIDEYIAEFPPATQGVLRQMRALIREAAPGATETISYAIPTFDLRGRHLVHFAGYERHIGFYPGASGVAAFKAELGAYKSAKGSIQFPLGQPLPEDLIRRIVESRVAEDRGRASKQGRGKPPRETNMSDRIEKITPFLWFDDQAEEAARFYVSVFRDAAIHGVTHYGEGAPLPAGTVMTVDFSLEGRRFTALNGGPAFAFTEAVSFVVHCRDQDEVDHYWDNLSTGGDAAAQICGWLKDKYGLSWQIVPDQLPALLGDPDPDKARRTMQALLQMKKLDIATLQHAHDGVEADAGEAAGG